MKPLEERIQSLLISNHDEKWKRFGGWKFVSPSADLFSSDLSAWNHPIVQSIHRMIEKAPEGECITSSSQYIRDYRRWYEEDNEQEIDRAN